MSQTFDSPRNATERKSKRKNRALRFLNVVLCGLLLGAALTSCDSLLGSGPADSEKLDGAISGLTPEQLRMHVISDQEFGRVFSAADGVGPVFNAQSCEGCHIADGRGHSSTMLIRFGRQTDSSFDPMIAFGGPQLQDRAMPGFLPEQIPSGATARTALLAPPVTGLGYLEAVDDADILKREDPSDADGDGISGVASFVAPPDFLQPLPTSVLRNGKMLGRFGRKAGAVSLLHQTVLALINDMGLSSEFHPDDLPARTEAGQIYDTAPDPEISAAEVQTLTYYVKTLKVPPRHHANDEQTLRGEALFSQIGCASCHTPTMMTGSSDVEALDHKEFHPYTDLLLHDMGSELNDGYTEAAAQAAEWRTTPLWGLGLAGVSTGGQILLLHDGRAHSVREAIRYHGGEAARSRGAFDALPPSQQDDLLYFLDSL